ncbi:hypothetical protein [Paenibacillus sp. CF384]|uniref:hypothetical protein n=1 Tax=Paenibacillus sp. CF384 TaxID=1884382 RepID=UPI0008987DA1|nr:hypothetical protein [Paenibacillus sp. CF384]SDW07853.1 hypothetical protein SAMN05518855_1001187 [Paenibacillus sp. CF384]
MSIRTSVRNRVLLTAALSATLLAYAQPSAFASPATTVNSPTAITSQSVSAKEISSSEYAAFLKDKFGLTLPENVSRGEFFVDVVRLLDLSPADKPVTFNDLNTSSPYYNAAAALHQNGLLSSDTANASAQLKAVNAVQLALRLAGFKELAYTYSEAKAEKAIAKLPIKLSSLNKQTKQELAAAIDTGLLPASYFNQIAPNAPVSADLANLLIGKTLVLKGQYKHYLGYVGDSDIYTKLADAYHGSVIIKDDKLQTIVDTALEQGLVTGYNLKDSQYDSNFIESLKLVYGHSDLQHALQLIGLLRSEGLEAKVQFEPKTSAFVYLKEWGEPGVSDQYEVRQISNGNYIEYAKEYDISFEFEKAADKQRFNAIISAYAKKNEENQLGLLVSSWWQPLYYSLTPLADYKEITNNKIQLGRYYAQSFSLKEQSKATIDGFKHVDPSVNVQSYDFWTDIPFFNYLNGEPL